MRFPVWLLLMMLFGLAISAGTALAMESPTVGPKPELHQTVVSRAIEYLASKQSPDGSFSPQMGIGPTALAALGMLRSGRAAADPVVAKALEYLEKYVQENGGIYTPGSHISTYETCVAMVCFREANEKGRFDRVIAGGEKFIRGAQWDESKGKEPSDFYYGGAGYGGKSRPDLSNTAFLIEALRSCGAGADDEALKKALVFVSRCQNFESPHNTTPYAAKINDGSFYYTCVVGRQDEERGTPDGGLRGYGSMTYSGLKSMVYAGLAKDDPRVEAAIKWIGKNYDVKTNPGMGDAGLFYYYHTFAKALDAFGADFIVDAAGVKHDWRKDLTEELASRQRSDGSWVNKNPRWMESDSNLATAFALLALSYCGPKQVGPVQR